MFSALKKARIRFSVLPDAGYFFPCHSQNSADTQQRTPRRQEPTRASFAAWGES